MYSRAELELGGGLPQVDGLAKGLKRVTDRGTNRKYLKLLFLFIIFYLHDLPK